MTDTSAVEQLAEALWDANCAGIPDPELVAWEQLPDVYRDMWRVQARAAFTAAAGLGWVGPEDAGRMREEITIAEALLTEVRADARELLAQRDEVLALCAEDDSCSHPHDERYQSPATVLAGEVRGILAREGPASPPESAVEPRTVPEAQSAQGGQEADGSVDGSEVAFYVDPGRHNCQRCGDTNHDTDRVCLTCTYPDHPCSAVWWESNPDAIERMKTTAANGQETT